MRRRIHVPDRVPSFSTPDELFEYAGEYLKDHPELSGADENGVPYADVAVSYDRDQERYVFEGFVFSPEGERRAHVRPLCPAFCRYPVLCIRVPECRKCSTCSPCTPDDRCRLVRRYVPLFRKRGHDTVVFHFIGTDL